MGIKSIWLGKGIILSPSMIYKIWKTQIDIHIASGAIFGYDELDDIVNLDEYNFDVVHIGHDAFTSRSTDSMNHIKFPVPQIFKLTEHEDIIKTLLVTTQNLPANFKIDCNVFIGMSICLNSETNNEFEGYVRTPELLYGLATLLPAIINASQILADTDVSILSKVQKPLMWTFADKCSCCFFGFHGFRIKIRSSPPQQHFANHSKCAILT